MLTRYFQFKSIQGFWAGVLALGVSLAGTTVLQSGPATRVADAIWANDELYDTVGTDTSFASPPVHSLDRLFNFAGSGLAGQRAVAESAPGDPDYNGGRWSLMLVSFTDMGRDLLDLDGDGQIDVELTSKDDVMAAEALNLVTIIPAGVYFECPLLRH